jgi:hypothetical protein
MGQTRNVTNAKSFPTCFSKSRCQHQPRGDPGESCYANFGKRRREEEAGQNRQWKTASPKNRGVKKFHSRELAANASKGK